MFPCGNLKSNVEFEKKKNCTVFAIVITLRENKKQKKTNKSDEKLSIERKKKKLVTRK